MRFSFPGSRWGISTPLNLSSLGSGEWSLRNARMCQVTTTDVEHQP